MDEAASKAAMEDPAASHDGGFFGNLVNTLKNIGGTVIGVAPAIIKAVTPIVKSVTDSSTPVPTDGGLDPGRKPLVKQASIAELMRGGQPVPTPATAPNVPDAPSVADTGRIGESFKEEKILHEGIAR